MVCGVWDKVLGTSCILQGTFPKGNGFPKICLCLPSLLKPPSKSAAQSIPGESGGHVQEFKVKWSRTKKFYTDAVKE